MQKTIYIDLDDVLCDTAGAYLALVQREFGKKFDFEDIHTFNLQKSFSLTDVENKEMFRLAHTRNFVLNIPVIEQSQKVMAAWKRQGHILAIVTGRHTRAYHDSLKWLEDNAIPYDSFTMVDKYGWENTDHDLAISLENLKKRHFHFAVEDNPEMALFLSRKMQVPVLLHARPWNENIHNSANISRFSCWLDIKKIML